MKLIKNNLDYLIKLYLKYFDLKKEEIKDYVELREKIKKKLSKNTVRELKNIEIEIKVDLDKKERSWENYVGIRLAMLAVVVTGITTLISVVNEAMYWSQAFIKLCIVLSVVYLFSFTNTDLKIENKKMFYRVLLECVHEVLNEKCNKTNKINKRCV